MKVNLFYMDGCPACEAFKPEFRKIEASGLVQTAKYNVLGSHKDWPPTDGDITRVPTIVIQNGKSVRRYTGTRTAAAILDAVQSSR